MIQRKLDSNKQVVSVEVTNEKTHDSQKADPLIKTARQKAKEKCKRVEKVIADIRYDTHRTFRHERGIEPCILPRSSARISGNTARDKVIRLISKRAWKEASGYGKRWLVESFFSVFKRWFGEYVSHMKIENIRKEVMFKVWIINLFLGLGG